MINVNLRHLHYLVTLTEAGSFSAAATAAHISQSTLTSAIQGLEEELGGLLIDRSQRRVTLLPFGEAVVAKARHILDQIQQLPGLTAIDGAPLTTKLRLGMIPSIAPFALPKLLPALRARYPDLSLKVREGLTQDLLRLIDSGELDAAFIAHVPPEDDYAHAVVARDPFSLAVPAQHRLANASEANVGDLGEETLLLLGQGHCLREHVLSAVGRGLQPGAEDVRAHSITTLVQLVENGMGVTLLPDIAIKAGAIAGTSLQLIPFDGPRASRTLVLAWRHRSVREADFRALSALLGELFEA
ncbi:LysR substrate-binding domain-containing protein [Tardiphaga sp.]|uniref:LysR substrate-binding domain-containing protein n=1 Tax=Tardiphaga sp. TaxID=1926292 RepID=UPI0037DA01BB